MPSTNTTVAHYDCGKCGEEIHLHGPDGVHELVCGHCGYTNVVLVGESKPMTAKRGN